MGISSLFSQNLSTVDVNGMTDQQIQRLIQQATSQGMTTDEIIEAAKSRGASDEQIQAVKKRLMTDQLKKEKESGIKTDKTKTKDVYLMTNEELYEYSLKAAFEASEKAKRVFGFQFFNSDKLTFEPSVNIPMPKDYILGVNDELTVNIWGASQQTYSLTIDRNGTIFIPEVGSIPVLGLTLEEASKLIKRRLVSAYAGMAGPNPNTWADVTVTGIRSIKVNVVGEVMVPGTYTLPATASAFNALYLCGGPNENGSFRNIRIMRDNKVIKILDVYEYLVNADGRNNIPLRDQDIILVPPCNTQVIVDGLFKRKGLFELKEGETMSQLINYAGGFAFDAYSKAVSVSRITDKERKMVDVHEKEFSSFRPQNGDSIWVGKVLNRYENRVHISGAVMRPGVYALDPGMKLSDLIEKAQGLREDAFLNRGLIYRLEKDLTPSAVSFNVQDVVSQVSDMPLQREDSVVIQDIFSMREKRFVRVYGEVQKPGRYPYFEGMTISDLLFQAGGLKEAAM
jgi:protein involved in polysaccharide export with SLBB domain